MTGHLYDVAISLLSRDQAVGQAIYDRLSEGLNVFFYPRNQEALAGTDGLESMRKPFLEDARVIVVLYREPWGQTPWTRVEGTAIKDRCLQKGWRFLFFIRLDASELPAWLPETNIGFDFDNYGIEQAVGAIKAKVQECGGVIEPMTALRRADIYKQEEAHQRARQQLLRSQEGIERINAKAVELFHEMERLSNEINDTKGIGLRAGANAGRCVITNNRVSIAIGWRLAYSNVADGSFLTFKELNGQVALPTERLSFIFAPQVLGSKKFAPELSRAGEAGWIEQGAARAEFLSSKALAEKCVIQFLDLVGRADMGKVPFPRS